MPKYKVINPNTGITEIVDTDAPDFDEESAKLLADGVESNRIKVELIRPDAEVKPQPRNINRIPTIEALDKLTGHTDTLARLLGAGTSLLGTGISPLTAPLSIAAAGYNLKNPPQTFSDAAANAIVPRGMGQAGKLLNKLKGYPSRILTESMLAGGGAVGENALRTETNRAFDSTAPRQESYLPSTEKPLELLSLLSSMGLSGIGGALGVRTERNKPKQTSQFVNEALGMDTKPWDYKQQLEQLNPGDKLQVPLTKEQEVASRLGKDILKTERLKNMTDSDIAGYKGQISEANKDIVDYNRQIEKWEDENTRKIGKLQAYDKNVSPDMHPAIANLYKEQEDLTRMLSVETDLTKKQAIVARIQQLPEEVENIQKSIQNEIIERSKKFLNYPEQRQVEHYKDLKTNKQQSIQDLNKSIADAEIEKKQYTDTIIQAKNKASQGAYDARVKGILDTSDTPEALAHNLMNSSESELEHFLTIMDKNHPKNGIRQAVLEQYLLKSFDPQTERFSNFKKYFLEPTAQYPNIQNRLSVIYGSPDRAKSVINMIQALDHAAETQKKFNNMQDFAVSLGAGSIIWSMTHNIIHKPGETLGKVGRGIGGILVLQTPKLLDYAAKHPKAGKIIENYLQQGAPSKNLQIGSPIYKILMDIGAEPYEITDNGSLLAQ
jgi:hypothetical protein